MRYVIAITLCLSLFLSIGCATNANNATGTSEIHATDRPLVQYDSGIIVHMPSTTFFFPQTGGFYLVGTRIYDVVGENVSVGYNMMSPAPAAVTIYVYPADDFLREYEMVKKAISDMHNNAQPLLENDNVLAGVKGKYAQYEYIDSFFGARKMVNSYVYLYETGAWFVKVRITYAKDEAAVVESEIESFFKVFSFPSRDRLTGKDIYRFK
jgi:hypothetical protein